MNERSKNIYRTERFPELKGFKVLFPDWNAFQSNSQFYKYYLCTQELYNEILFS
jgi:hypothetical protein